MLASRETSSSTTTWLRLSICAVSFGDSITMLAKCRCSLEAPDFLSTQLGAGLVRQLSMQRTFRGAFGGLGGLGERASAVLCTCLGLRLRLRSGKVPNEKAEQVGDASPSSSIACSAQHPSDHMQLCCEAPNCRSSPVRTRSAEHALTQACASTQIWRGTGFESTDTLSSASCRRGQAKLGI